MIKSNVEETYTSTRKQWRSWLKKNHLKKNKVYLIKYKKHTGKPTLNNKEAMEEAICYGWIDTTIKRLDDKIYRQCFVKRNSKSKWSNNTLKYGKEMIEKGKMSPFGLKMYEEGLKKGPMDHNLPDNPKTPKMLKRELDKKKNKKLKESFDSLSPSAKRYAIYWLENAKQEETKKKRIKIIFEKLKEGKRSVF